MHCDRRVPWVVCVAWLLAVGSAAAQPPAPPPPASMEAVALACAPAAVFDEGSPAGPRILGADEGPRQGLYFPGDTLVVSGGTTAGLNVDDQFFVRRRGRRVEHSPRVNGVFPIHVTTAGWIRIIDVAADHSLATVVYACDGIIQGDYLEPFALPSVPAVAPIVGNPDYDARGRVLFGPDGKLTCGNRELMVVYIGTEQGLTPGQRLTVFRQQYGASGPVLRVGNATALTVNATTAVIRVDTATDAVFAGDFVALHR